MLVHRSALGLVALAKKNWHLLDEVTESLRDEGHFGVKAPVVNGREREESLGGVVAEALETAGDVRDARCRDDVRQPSEAFAQALAPQRLMAADVRSRHLARADYHLVAAVQLSHKGMTETVNHTKLAIRFQHTPNLVADRSHPNGSLYFAL